MCEIAVLMLMFCDSYSVEPDYSARYDNNNLSVGLCIYQHACMCVISFVVIV